ncbi:MAG: hypothetical protein P4L62_04230 [Candidatus Pacebacteria bacterium]|nr:hypothetical protein [Candidatus Paceibacterota bacterium]MDR3583539.1 hypothetical protein [Candidatus Paceibacterota bacterium]
MNKFRRILIAYTLALLFLVVIEVIGVNAISISKGRNDIGTSLYWIVLFSVVIILNLIFLGLFTFLGFLGFKNNRIFLKSLSEGTLIWLWITFIPAISLGMLFHQDLGVRYLFWLIQLVLGGYLIYHYKLPKGLIILAIILPGISNLYFLVYGMHNQESPSIETIHYRNET